MGVTSRRPATQADRAERSDWPDQLVALYEQTYRGHVRLVYAMVGSRHEAEELVQESVIEIGRHWGEIDRPGAYLRRTVVNRAIGLLRRRKTEQRHQIDPPPPPRQRSTRHGPGRRPRCRHRRARRRVACAVPTPPRRRHVARVSPRGCNGVDADVDDDSMLVESATVFSSPESRGDRSPDSSWYLIDKVVGETSVRHSGSAAGLWRWRPRSPAASVRSATSDALILSHEQVEDWTVRGGGLPGGWPARGGRVW